MQRRLIIPFDLSLSHKPFMTVRMMKTNGGRLGFILDAKLC